jgi:hypothetical protein
MFPSSIASLSGSKAIALAHLPAPIGANLITELTTIHHGHIADRLRRLLGALRTPAEIQGSAHSYLLYWIALAVAAFEVTRRLRRLIRGTRRSRQSRGTGIYDFLWRLP